ncbi:hypothetical protein HII36_31225 [Nonomuraea sp. NN258]|uniref:hypothetical protein n=1 Tax=Nonomuraea antri TaxID=2730852 RepID=UPI0015683CCE|nr:hypothetical protein [Nonomuraea antri]NRQ36273.1 hypothetical protein [Nonomuraea antri]
MQPTRTHALSHGVRRLGDAARRALGATAIAGIIAGCAAQPAGQPPAALTTAEIIQVEQAEQTLIQRCMARHGFSYWPPAQLSEEERKGSGFMLTDVEWARKNGYGGRLRARIMAAKTASRNHAYAGGLPAGELRRYNQALDGGDDAATMTVRLPSGGRVTSKSGGCLGEALERLYGDRSTWFESSTIATNLQPLYVPGLLADQRFQTVLRSWSRCMEARGHAYPDPPAIRSALPGLTKGLDQDAAHAVEVELAVAEATCARAASYIEVAGSLEDEYRERAGRPYADELNTYRRLKRAAFDQARQINRNQP